MRRVGRGQRRVVRGQQRVARGRQRHRQRHGGAAGDVSHILLFYLYNYISLNILILSIYENVCGHSCNIQKIFLDIIVILYFQNAKDVKTDLEKVKRGKEGVVYVCMCDTV